MKAKVCLRVLHHQLQTLLKFEFVLQDAVLCSCAQQSWVVDIWPLIDKRDLQDRRDFDLRYSNGIKDHLIQTSRMKVLTCPADDSASERDGALSYVVNAGYSERWRIPECHVHVLSALVRKLKFLFGIMSGDEKCGSE